MEYLNAITIVIFDSECRILLLRELKENLNYGKMNKNMLGFPAMRIETDEDENLAISRLISKEVGRPLSRQPELVGQHIIRVSMLVTARLIVYTGCSDESFEARPSDRYVEHAKWAFPRQFLDSNPWEIRTGAQEVLREYLAI